ncbi:MAG TPA: hypothetical protein VI387_09210 [Candidatus Brocadiales bacterium]|nr:hypothetical protein [Candidatus Brocadiales bacterium]
MTTEDIKIALGLTLTLSLFGLFGFLPSILYLARGIIKKFNE